MSMTLAEKVAKFRKGKSHSAVILYSVERETKFSRFPATICPDGLPQLVAANSPQQVKQYQEMGFAIYKEAKVAASLQVADSTEATKRTRKATQDE